MWSEVEAKWIRTLHDLSLATTCMLDLANNTVQVSLFKILLFTTFFMQAAYLQDALASIG
jgi:hypothetical protein